MKRFALILVGAVAVPLAATTFTVTNTNDSGTGSLRQAIQDSEGNPGLDTIAFNIPGAGVHTISPATQLPFINGPVVIDGYTQSGSSVNTDPVGTNAVLLIELDGTNTAPFGNGLQIANGSTVRGLVINRWSTAISVNGGVGNIIVGNFIGTDPSGTIARLNGAGIGGTGVATDTLIGSAAPADRNLISGNAGGISAGDAIIQGNLLGTDKSGLAAIPNTQYAIS